MKSSRLRLIIAAVVPLLVGIAVTWPGGISLRAQTTFTGGPIILMGIDAEEQAGGGGTHPTPADYTTLIKTMLSEVSNGGSGILVIGAGKATCEGTLGDGIDHSRKFWEMVGTNFPSENITYLNGVSSPGTFDDISDITIDHLSMFKMVAVASSDIEIASGCGLKGDENDALTTRREDIKSFVNRGGALLGFTATGLTQPYGYIAEFGSFSFRTGLNYDNITPTTPDGTALGITDAAFDKCCWHDTFVSHPSFLKVLATAETSTDRPITNPGQAAAIGGRQIVLELCNAADGSPNGVDEDGDGFFDEGCYRERQLSFSPTSTNQTATFMDLGDVRDNSFGLRYMLGVLGNFNVTIRATLQDAADVAFSGELDPATKCSSNKLEATAPATSKEPCVRYQITGGVAGTDYVAGDRAVQFTIAFFQPNSQKDPNNDGVMDFDPVMGYSAGCGTFDKSILDHAIFPPGEDPEGIGYVDEYGSCVIMGVKTKPTVAPANDLCHADGTPDGIDDDRDGVVDDGCGVAKSFTFSTNQMAHTYEFNDLGSIKPNSIRLDHKRGVTAPFTVTARATIVNRNDPGLTFGPTLGSNPMCASNLAKSGDNACVLYEFIGQDPTKYGTGTDAIEFKNRYFAPDREASGRVAGMAFFTHPCPIATGRNILRFFNRFPGDSDPTDPEGIGYVDEYGSCVIMTGSDPPGLVLNLPADMTVVATSAAGAPVSFTATASGLTNGVPDPNVPVTCTPPSGSIFPIGQTTVSCTASDSVETTPGVKRTTTGTFKVNVVYGICAQYDTVRPKKAGSTIPIKLRLCTVDGIDLSSPDIVLHATSLMHSGDDVVGDPEDPGSSQPDDNFRFTDGMYHFNLKTTGLALGLWTLNFTVGGDPTVYTTSFAIK